MTAYARSNPIRHILRDIPRDPNEVLPSGYLVSEWDKILEDVKRRAEFGAY